MASSTPPVGSSFESANVKPLISQLIDTALLRLNGKILSIEAEEIRDAQGQPDRDHNHRITLGINPNEKEPASIFALRLNGNPKQFETLAQELKLKVENHLAMRQNENFIALPSGAFIASEVDIPIAVQNGYLTIDDKIAVMQAGDKYVPIPAIVLNTYTFMTASQEDQLIVIQDEHDKIRTDGKEGFIINTEQVLSLKKDQLQIHSKDTQSEHLPAQGNYFILHRSRAEALNLK